MDPRRVSYQRRTWQSKTLPSLILLLLVVASIPTSNLVDAWTANFGRRYPSLCRQGQNAYCNRRTIQNGKRFNDRKVISPSCPRSHLAMAGTDAEEEEEVDFNTLIDMDVVVYSKRDDPTKKKYLATLEEDGSLAPLSAWTTEHAFGTSVEFLVDEEDRFVLPRYEEATNVIQLHYRIDENELSYGSRQCTRGVHNPHGEHCENLFYVEQSVLDKFGVEVILKPELEILW